MKTADVKNMDYVGVYGTGEYGWMLYIRAIVQDNDTIRVIYTDYFGCAYKHKVYNVYADPFFLHDGMRIHLADCEKVRKSGSILIQLGEYLAN